MLSLSSLSGALDDRLGGAREGVMSLFMLGFAIGTGVTVTAAVIESPSSVTERLRADRAGTSVTVSLGGIAIAAPTSAPEATESSAAIELGPSPDELEAVPEPEPAQEIIDPERSTAFLEQRFDEAQFDLDAIRGDGSPVPRLTAAAVPLDLGDMVDIPRRKTVFVQMVLPLILLANEEILADRARLTALQAKESLDADEQAWLDVLAATYKTEPTDFESLLKRVDAIPPSLAIAQAAVESGWGTSRFAIEGNALFGQWIWGDDADGIVPEDRIEGKDHKIRAFDTPYDAVAAYARNLNRHRAYAQLRDLRAEGRAAGETADGAALAAGLESYSEKGAEYITLIRNIISTNDLAPLDTARLGTAPA